MGKLPCIEYSTLMNSVLQAIIYFCYTIISISAFLSLVLVHSDAFGSDKVLRNEKTLISQCHQSK